MPETLTRPVRRPAAGGAASTSPAAPVAPPPARPLTPGDLAEVVFRHKWKVLLTPLLIMSAATAIILFAPRTYQSEAKLFLQVGRESVGLDPTATTGSTINLQQTGRDAEVVSAMEVLGSRGLIARVVDELGPDYVLRGGPAGEGPAESTITDALMAPPKWLINQLKSIDPVPAREEAIIQIEENLLIDSEKDSMVIVVQLDAETARGAQEMLATLVDLYKQEHLRIHRNPESQMFFAEQRKSLEKRLEEANEKVKTAKNRMGIASIEGRRMTLEGQLRVVEQEVYNTEQNLATAVARVDDLNKQLSTLPERMVASRKSVPNEGADLLRNQLYALQTRKMELKARYNDAHPLVKAISAQVDEAKKVVEDQSEQREETVDDVNPIHRELSLELKQQQSVMAGYQARLKTLDEQKKLIHGDLEQLNQHEIELDELDREVAIARGKYFKYAENLEQARIDQALEEERISSVSVPQPATRSEKPVSPSKLLVGLGAMLLAFGGTVSWVAASEHLNDRVRTTEDVETQLGVPVFAEVPKSKVHGRVLSS
ncbi:MAG: Wzz/FepE/Etk N-terminal domain-containing protein [Planctomycetota bacterium]